MDSFKIRKYLISNYFCNLKENKINSEILLLTFNDKKIFKQFSEYLIIKNYKSLIITSLKELTKEDLNNRREKNIILIEDKEISFGKLKIFRDIKIRILFARIIDFDEIRSYIESKKKYYIKNLIESDNYHNFYLENESVNNIIDNIIDNVNYAKNFISTFLNYKNNSELVFSKYTIKLFLLRTSNTVNTMLNDIEYFENTGVLTSRLGIFIYKICTFFHDATDKRIGLYYSQRLGKSKPYNNKRFNIKNTKGYFVNNIQQRKEHKIRSEIASKLLTHTNLDKNLISGVTGVSFEEVCEIKINKIINEL